MKFDKHNACADGIYSPDTVFQQQDVCLASTVMVVPNYCEM